MGKGAFPGTDDRYTGMLGMHGTKTSNFGVSECDLLIALGARFSDRVVGNPKKFAENAKVLHIDIDAAEINKNIRTDVSIVGDLKEVLGKLNAKLEGQKNDEWMEHIAQLKAKYPLNYDSSVLSCPYVMEEIEGSIDEHEVRSFNSVFELYVGTEYEELLNEDDLLASIDDI